MKMDVVTSWFEVVLHSVRSGEVEGGEGAAPGFYSGKRCSRAFYRLSLSLFLNSRLHELTGGMLAARAKVVIHSADTTRAVTANSHDTLSKPGIFNWFCVIYVSDYRWTYCIGTILESLDVMGLTYTYESYGAWNSVWIMTQMLFNICRQAARGPSAKTSNW